jgi:hypothetical protein
MWGGGNRYAKIFVKEFVNLSSGSLRARCRAVSTSNDVVLTLKLLHQLPAVTAEVTLPLLADDPTSPLPVIKTAVRESCSSA